MEKKIVLIFFGTLVFSVQNAISQCSICTKTAQQLGSGPASALNSGIVYLMLAPLCIMGILGYRWWRGEMGDK